MIANYVLSCCCFFSRRNINAENNRVRASIVNVLLSIMHFDISPFTFTTFTWKCYIEIYWQQLQNDDRMNEHPLHDTVWKFRVRFFHIARFFQYILYSAFSASALCVCVSCVNLYINSKVLHQFISEIMYVYVCETPISINSRYAFIV